MRRTITKSAINMHANQFTRRLLIKNWRNLAVLLTCVLAVALVIFKINQIVSADTSTPASISSLGTPVTENFNTLALTGPASTTPTGWGFAETGTAANTTYSAGTGSGNTGDTYSFGAASNTERALGGLQSGALVPTIGAVYVNNTGATITSLTITYTGEQWRLGVVGRTDRLDFQYSTNATSLLAGTYTDVNALDFSGPISTGTAGALDGNAAANRSTITSTIPGLSISNGSTVWIRWNSVDVTGADDGLAVDDFSITANGVAAPDSAPAVASSIPAHNAINVAANSNVSITFNEAVNVTGNWFQIACATSGTRQVADTLVTGGPTTFTIDPNTDFATNEQCTVTVFAANVTDQDADDPPDAMVADAVFSFTVAGPSFEAGSVVVSQIYGGGGNAGATLKQDFIEIINHTAAPINLAGWSVQWANATTPDTWFVTPLTNFNLQPGQYYLIQESQGAGGTVDLVNPDAIGTITVGSTGGRVALVSNTTPLTGSCPTGGAIIDFVGYGATACFEGSGPTAATSNTTAALRDNNGCRDTNNNAADFVIGAPNPRNSSAATNNCAVLTGYGSANPFGRKPGESTTLNVLVTPGSAPPSTGITVTADLSLIGGSAAQPFSGVGNSFSFVATVGAGTTPGLKNLPVTINDAQGRTANTTISLLIQQLHVNISQIYGGGGNASATFSNDFVELYNPTAGTVDLTGWSLQYTSAAGEGWEFTRQPIGGTIGTGEYLLISLASGGAVGAPLPPANIVGDINMSGTTGKVALVSSFDPLEGPCPLSNPTIVDFVGYGSGANCAETANAPAPSNTTAIFRQANGATDSDNNLADFFTATPNPRRTAPIVELGPFVFGTDPRNNGVNAPRDASMTVNFTEAVDVVGSWYDITCASTGQHNDATVAGAAKTYVITPNVNFQAGEQCTVTIFKEQIHDTDLDDSGPNSDTLLANHVWTFTVATGTAPAYPAGVHLTMGNPNGATNDPFQQNNYLMEKPEFALAYNSSTGSPNWVSWHLADEWIGTLTRVDTFRPDPAVLPTWYRVQATDFSNSGFDRGHMVPNADRDKETSIPINQATFLMSNMIAQSPDNNQGPWADFENYLRTLAPANEMYIVAGPSGAGGTGSAGFATTIANGHVLVPSSTWKVVLVIPKGENDISRVTAASRTIAIEIPNVQGIRTNPWEQYITTVDEVEDLTGYDFFSNVPDAIENAIEAGTNGTNPPGTGQVLATTAEDNAVSITLNAASPQPSPTFTSTIVSPPAHGSLSGSGLNLTYTPAANYNGPDSFSYRVNDGSQNSNVSFVDITVTEVNDAPTASDDSASTNQDAVLNINASVLTTNDSAGPPNEATQMLTVTNVTGTPDTHGSVSLSSGVVTYTPAAGYNGPASFTYQVCDNGTTNGVLAPLCVNATVNVTVNATAPVLAANGATVSQESCPAFNNAVDPGERVSVNLKLINNGNAATSNLVGTLQASANVVAPSGPVSFGAIAASGGTAGRDFSFTAVGNCGDSIILSLKLQDGATDRGTVTYTFILGGGGPCTTPCGAPNVVVTTTLTRQNATTVVANISIQNIGSVTASNVILNNAKLGTTNGTPLPQSGGNLVPGGTFNTTVNFTNSTPGANSNLVVGGSYTGGTFSTTKRVTIP